MPKLSDCVADLVSGLWMNRRLLSGGMLDLMRLLAGTPL